MKQNLQERLNSESIREGLLSIKNSQIELLNELKLETEHLKNTPIRLPTSEDSPKSSQQTKRDHIFSFPPQKAESVVYRPSSPSHTQRPFMAGLSNNNKDIQSQLTYLKDENKMMNQTLQKLLYSRSLDKQRVRELESYLYFSSKIHIQLINQLLNGTNISEVRRNFQNDLKLNSDVYSKYQESSHQLILQLLQERDADQQQFRISSSPQKDHQITSQLGQLKDQLAALLKNNYQKSDAANKGNLDVENTRLKEQSQNLTRRYQQLQKRIVKLESDNKELALCWERQINQRKTVEAELERAKKATGISERERQMQVYVNEIETKLANANKWLKDKETAESDSNKKLSDAITLLKEENQRLKKESKTIEELRTMLQREDEQTSKHLENEMRAKIGQQGQMLRNYEQEIFDLRNHLGQVKVNLEVMAQMQAKHKEMEATNQELYWKKVHAIKTNSTVEHLWQVKKVEYDNINELLQEMHEKIKKV